MSEVDSGQVSLQAPKPKKTKQNLLKPIEFDDSALEDLPEHDIEIEAEQPVQEVRYKWEYKPRQNAKWGTVVKEGLIIGRGDNKKVVPPDEVWKLASIGCTDEEISSWFGIDRQTLKYNFLEYMQKGRLELRQRLRQAQIKTAINGNAALQIWLGKQYLGQQENPNASESNQPLPWNDD